MDLYMIYILNNIWFQNEIDSDSRHSLFLSSPVYVHVYDSNTYRLPHFCLENVCITSVS